MKDNVKKLTPREVIYTAPDDKTKREELNENYMPVTAAILYKYRPEDLTNKRNGYDPKSGGINLAELHVKNVEAAYIEAETGCENPVFFYSLSNTFVMVVTNQKTTGSNIIVSGGEIGGKDEQV